MEKSKVDSFGHSFACLLLLCLKPVALSFRVDLSIHSFSFLPTLVWVCLGPLAFYCFALL